MEGEKERERDRENKRGREKEKPNLGHLYARCSVLKKANVSELAQ